MHSKLIAGLAAIVGLTTQAAGTKPADHPARPIRDVAIARTATINTHEHPAQPATASTARDGGTATVSDRPVISSAAARPGQPPASHAAPAPKGSTPAPRTAPAPIYGDVLTAHTGYNEWAITLLDTQYRLPADYRPSDLVSVSVASIDGGGQVRSFVIDDLRAMAAAARAAGNPLAVASAFRSYSRQKKLFQGYVAEQGYDVAVIESARPGHSEHQLGTTFDFKSATGPDPWKVDDWASTPAGQWMCDNAWRFGFVMSYPEAATADTGYMYEPWHYRYVGRPEAASIKASGLTTRTWLYLHGAAVVSGYATYRWERD